MKRLPQHEIERLERLADAIAEYLKEFQTNHGVWIDVSHDRELLIGIKDYTDTVEVNWLE